MDTAIKILLACLAVSVLPAQSFAPGSIDWATVDLSACGDFPSAGKNIKVSMIGRSSDPEYVPIDPKLLPYRKMGDDPMPAADRAVSRPLSDNCWPVELWLRAFAVVNTQCTRCHGSDRPSGGLDMRTRAGILKGGESGPGMKPGTSAGSLIYQRIVPRTKEQAAANTLDIPQQDPPNGPLFGPEIEAIRIWIANGAPAVE